MVQQRLMRRHARWAVAASVIAALVMGGAGGWVLHGQMMPPDSGIALLAREAAANHLVYTADRRRPTELGATQREVLAHWVSNRLKRTVTVPDLSSAGFQFLGGRLAATHEGPAGLFMYQNQTGVRLTVFVRPVTAPQNMPIRQVDAGGLPGCAWTQDGIGYTVIAAVPATDLRAVAEQVRRLSQNAV
jgi:anti-sigma factor RsiW